MYYSKKKIVFWIIPIILGTLFDIKVFYYIFFLLFSFLTLRKGINEKRIISILLYSCILPDNYTIVIVSLILLIFEFLISKGKIRISVLEYILILVYILSALINVVPMVNIGFSIIYLLPTFLISNIFTKKWDKIDKFELNKYIVEIIIIEGIATLFNCFGYLIGQKGGDDWSLGTLGESQQSILFLMIAFVAFRIIIEFLRTRNIRLLIPILSITLILISTNSRTLLGIFCITLTIVLLTLFPIWKTMGLIVIIPIVLTFSMPIEVRNQVQLMFTDKSYFEQRFSKYIIFEAVFEDIPSKDLSFATIGSGPGYFSSRAAATCSGEYVSMYNNYFNVSMSKYTQEYVYPLLKRANEASTTDYGSVLALPNSSIASIKGEYGVVGLIIFLAYVYVLQKNRSKEIKVLILFFIGCLVIDNFLEYTKVVTVFFANYCLYNNNGNEINYFSNLVNEVSNDTVIK